jgi:hypothetical protein
MTCTVKQPGRGDGQNAVTYLIEEHERSPAGEPLLCCIADLPQPHWFFVNVQFLLDGKEARTALARSFSVELQLSPDTGRSGIRCHPIHRTCTGQQRTWEAYFTTLPMMQAQLKTCTARI